MRYYIGWKEITDIKANSFELVDSLLVGERLALDIHQQLMDVVWSALENDHVYFRHPDCHRTNIHSEISDGYLTQCQQSDFNNVVNNMKNIGSSVIITAFDTSNDIYFITCYVAKDSNIQRVHRQQYVDEILADL